MEWQRRSTIIEIGTTAAGDVLIDAAFPRSAWFSEYNVTKGEATGRRAHVKGNSFRSTGGHGEVAREL